MNRKDWQKAFGPTPDAFRVRVDETLERLEERDMRKRTKFATALIAAVLTVTLLAGAAFAAAKLDIWEALNMANPIIRGRTPSKGSKSPPASVPSCACQHRTT